LKYACAAWQEPNPCQAVSGSGALAAAMPIYQSYMIDYIILATIYKLLNGAVGTFNNAPKTFSDCGF
jgi:hypothetical protein